MACFTYNSNRLKEAFARLVSTDVDVCTDRRRCPHRPTQMSVSTDADVRIDRRRCPHRPTQMPIVTQAQRC
ncbi:hypothetical protein [Leyella stercorea]|uniref:hypothetical protein n=1 Tax=Leyella stercorea TaxID=363265 RepID=UPI00242B6E84|nr:hypothetical protein [Leyella stercorea]